MYVPQKFLTIHLTRACNSRCKFCTTDPSMSGNKIDNIDLKEVDELLASNKDQGFEAVSVIGGEPTIYRGLEDVLMLIQQHGYPMIQMATNGRRLASHEYAEKIVNLGVSFFTVSLHTSDPELHDDLTGAPGGWHEIVKSIQNIKKLGQEVQTMSVISQQTYRTLRQTVELLIDLDVDLIGLSAMCPGGLASVHWQDLKVSYEEIFPYLEEAIATCREAGRGVVLEGFPFCAVRPYQQLCAEYPDTRREKMLFHGHLIEDYDTCMNTTSKVRIPECTGCSVRKTCGGFYRGYANSFGFEDFTAITISSPAPEVAA
jgi:MoaA/NifB/PqqE/SkfB family radical SAM enzyme